MVDFNKVSGFLSEHRQGVLASASAAVARAHLPHYVAPHGDAGQAVATERLGALYALVERCAAERHLAPIAEYVTRIAVERHAAGIQLGEVQTAINVLEEAIWRAVLSDLPAEHQGEALGVVGTILGAVKDRLACAYVSLATQSTPRTLDFAELFQGMGEGDTPPV